MGTIGNAELPLEAGQVDANPAAGGHVEHVQGQHGRQPQFEHLADEIEIALADCWRRRCNDGIDRRGFLPPAQQQIDHHHFVARPRREAVQARQVDHLEPPAGDGHLADLLFHGHAGIVADVLMDADQAAEER